MEIVKTYDLENLKETISDKGKCIVNLKKENKELKEKNKMFYESITEGVKITKPSCFGKFEEDYVECGECLYLSECIDEIQNKI